MLTLKESFEDFAFECQHEICEVECKKENCPRLYRKVKKEEPAWRKNTNDGYVAYQTEHGAAVWPKIQGDGSIKEPDFWAKIGEENPNLNVRETIMKAFRYWDSTDGWKRKRRTGVQKINWPETYIKAARYEWNQVKKQGLI
jgi:hypothetical protein